MVRVRSRRLIDCDTEAELDSLYGAEALYYTADTNSYWKWSVDEGIFKPVSNQEIITIAAELLALLDTQISGTKTTNAFIRADWSWAEPEGGSGTNHFLGVYTSLANLEAAYPTATLGDYADVDAGPGTDAVRYIWDEDEGWLPGGTAGGGTAATTTFTPAGGLSSTNVQDALVELDTNINAIVGVDELELSYLRSIYYLINK